MQMHRSNGDTATHRVFESGRTGAEILVVRNYDQTERYEITVTFTDSADEVVVERALTVGPLETLCVRTSLERGLYRVEIETERGASGSASCVVGGNANECGLVEIGNGVLSVSDGYW
jgi:hypothetical protein